MRLSKAYRMRLRRVKIKNTGTTLEELLANVIETCEKLTGDDDKEFMTCTLEILDTALRKLREIR